MILELLAATFLGASANAIEQSESGDKSPHSQDFETQVLPVLTKAGCNGGSCHGAAIGRGGFRLSLLGYDPQADYDSLVNEFEGRRVNLAVPEKSLVLRKPSLDVDHEGGLRLTPGGDGYKIVNDWIAAGAPRGPSRRLVGLEVKASAKWLPEPGQSLSIQVIARFCQLTPTISTQTSPQTSEASRRHRPSVAGLTAFALLEPSSEINAAVVQEPLNHRGKPSGVACLRTSDPISNATPETTHHSSLITHQSMTEDVTRWAVFTPTDPAAMRVGPHGEVTVLGRGQSSVMVRFLGEVASVTVTVPINDGPAGADARPQANFIDEQVNRALDELRLPHSPRTDDGTFARRVFLDLIGTLPDLAEVEAFLAHAAVDKRARLVDQLMDRPEFVDLWSYKWGDLFRIESRRLQPEGAAAFHDFVRECVAKNTPLDVMAREMLLATGDSYRAGAANFSRVPNDARTHAEHVSRVFMGVRLQCANCHNHPLDRWTQDDYHGLAAVFARIDRSRDVKLLPRGDVIHPKTGQPAAPRIPGVQFLSADDQQRGQFADWLTAPDNPFFARAAVNRVWRELMGRGMVEPVDDHRATNPSTHAELLDAVARDFVEHGFDVRHTIQTIVISEAYQRSSLSLPGNRGDDRYYSKSLVRLLPPPVLADAVAKVSGVPEKLGSLPPGTTAVSLGDSRVLSEALDLLGRCPRDAECSTNTAASGSLPLTLHTINGPWLNAKITGPGGRLERLLDSNFDDVAIMSELYSVALSRRPTPVELGHWQTRLAAVAAEDRAVAMQDFLWALLNSAEFCCNH